jgi:glycosyltransferase involved in cell wall biosynthesis
VTIALTMIVRDEQDTIGPCLDTAKPLIDHWTICDTGSTDDTKQVIRDVLANIPGELHDVEWRDFGHNRTDALARARGTADYLLMLDADMRIDQRAPMPELDADEYLLRSTGTFEFTLPLLLKADRAWEYRGAAHAYLAVDDGQPVISRELEQLRIIDTREGGVRRDKLWRDLRLLVQELEEKPDDPRATFYLAQTYRDLGRSREAAALYRRRVELGGWAEEVFWACYQEGLCRAAIGEDPVPVMLEAYRRRPTRAEPIWYLAQRARLAGDTDQALVYAELASRIPKPDDTLFVLAWIYEDGIRKELELARKEAA